MFFEDNAEFNQISLAFNFSEKDKQKLITNLMTKKYIHKIKELK